MSASSLSKHGAGRPFVATVEQAVLAFMTEDPHRNYYDRQVADATGLSRGAVNGALRSLAKTGILLVERRGRMKFYTTNLDDPRARSFKILTNVAGLMPLVRRVAGHSLRIVLFGSAAEGRDTPESDYDLLVLTHTPDVVRRLIPTRGRRVQAAIFTPSGLAEMEHREPVFAGQVKRGLELWLRM